MKNIIKFTFTLLIVAVISTGCENFLTPSVDQNRPLDTITSVEDLNSLILGIYDDLNRVELYGRDFYVSADVMSDNAASNQNSGRFVGQAQYNFTENSGYAEGVWDVFYEAIATANIVIAADLESTPAVDHVKGQAYALRAFAHMNLELAFGQEFSGGTVGIPYVETYNVAENFFPPRNTVAEVWQKVGQDLATAETLMDPSFDSSNPTYFSTSALKGLQSRYYLYAGNYDAAIAAADAILPNYTPVAAGNLVAAWQSGTGPNSLFELGFTSTDRLGTDNIARILRNTNYGDVQPNEDLYTAYGNGDARYALFEVDGDGVMRMANKYYDELGSDNVRVLRYAEVLLNKAEALANRGTGTDLADAIAIINDFSADRGSDKTYVVGTQSEVIDAVLEERRLELAFEGHRLYDLLRHGKDIPYVNTGGAVNFTIGEDITYGSNIIALPIPRAELDANSSMVQNPGY